MLALRKSRMAASHPFFRGGFRPFFFWRRGMGRRRADAVADGPGWCPHTPNGV
jgi:hypothetical protein